jgi:hypothetical protein
VVLGDPAIGMRIEQQHQAVVLNPSLTFSYRFPCWNLQNVPSCDTSQVVQGWPACHFDHGKKVGDGWSWVWLVVWYVLVFMYHK